MAKVTHSTDMESIRPSLSFALLSVGCSFRNIPLCKVPSLPAAPDSQQVHYFSSTWLYLPDSNCTAAMAEHQGELCKSITCTAFWQTCTCVWLTVCPYGTRTNQRQIDGMDTGWHNSNELYYNCFLTHPSQSLINNHSNLAWSQKPRHQQPKQILTHLAILIWKQK